MYDEFSLIHKRKFNTLFVANKNKKNEKRNWQTDISDRIAF